MSQAQKEITRVAKADVDAFIKKIDGKDLATLASKGATKLLEGIFENNFTVPATYAGWKFQLINAGRDGAHKALIFLPANPKTREIWFAGQVYLGEEAGLNHIQAAAWAEARISRRHELLPLLAKIMKSEALQTAYLNFNPDSTRADLANWKNRYGQEDGLDTKGRNLVVELVKALRDAEERANNPAFQVLREQQELEKSTLAVNPLLAGILERKSSAAAKNKEDRARKEANRVVPEGHEADGQVALLGAAEPERSQEEVDAELDAQIAKENGEAAPVETAAADTTLPDLADLYGTASDSESSSGTETALAAPEVSAEVVTETVVAEASAEPAASAEVDAAANS